MGDNSGTYQYYCWLWNVTFYLDVSLKRAGTYYITFHDAISSAIGVEYIAWNESKGQSVAYMKDAPGAEMYQLGASDSFQIYGERLRRASGTESAIILLLDSD